MARRAFPFRSPFPTPQSPDGLPAGARENLPSFPFLPLGPDDSPARHQANPHGRPGRSCPMGAAHCLPNSPPPPQPLELLQKGHTKFPLKQEKGITLRSAPGVGLQKGICSERAGVPPQSPHLYTTTMGFSPLGGVGLQGHCQRTLGLCPSVPCLEEPPCLAHPEPPLVRMSRCPAQESQSRREPPRGATPWLLNRRGLGTGPHTLASP